MKRLRVHHRRLRVILLVHQPKLKRNLVMFVCHLLVVKLKDLVGSLATTQTFPKVSFVHTE